MSDLFDVGRGNESRSHDDSRHGTYNTMRPEPQSRPSGSFQLRTAVLFAVTAIMTAVVLSMVLAYVWEDQFQGYARSNMERIVRSTADTLGAHYDQVGGWSADSESFIKTIVGEYGQIGILVQDSTGRKIYDSVDKSNSKIKNEKVTKSLSTVTAKVKASSGREVGTVHMWARDSSSLLTETDARFRTDSYNAIVWAALIAVGIALVMGVFFSRSLVRPINRITSTARQIRNGDLTARTKLSGDDEIGRLGETFDEMATGLERDIKHERRLTGDVAHELRTPLMAIQATVEAMQDGVLPADEEHLQTVDDEVCRLSRLVDAMLHLSRLENGKTRFHPKHTDIVYLVRSLISMQERLFAGKGLRLAFDDKTAHHELYADVDPDGIREAITNLMSNAMRYTPEGGWVLVTVESDRDDVLISVRDTGIGIAKEEIPKIFSRFWRSAAGRERASGGLGVGLAITKGIIDLHNGTISVKSELGHGTTFTMRIPTDQSRHGRKQDSTEE
ncbi:sensor histidine kinase [Olegusella massiliensis]|uniref:sensor histidine kinase n=1 Tax=Olegusella massiliensis TaxID=1776381 RepID=UPI000838DD6F|nr:HAMP domain-containing sensor histidine kinase [Olegusella massiliensis]